MNKLLLIVSVLLYVCVVAGDEDADDYEEYDFWSWPPSYERTPLGDSIDVSSLKMLKATYEIAEQKNIVSSPLGLMMLLSLYNLGSCPDTSSEITRFLGGTDAKRTFDSFKELSVKFSEMNPDQLVVANKISVSNQFTLNETFASAARAYRCEFDTLDFTKPEAAATEINKWATEKTKGHITDPVSRDALTPDTAAALFNIIYFNGQWHVPFKAEETKEEDFHISHNDVVKKPMMHLLQPLYYAESEELGAKMVELPYKETGFRMIVVLPNKVDGLSSVLDKAAKKGLLSDVFRLSPTDRDVDFAMPKFEIRTKLDFSNILPKLGVSRLFNETAPGIVNNIQVKLSKAFQEAFIKVDEEGATAGAFTGLVIMFKSADATPPPPLKFTVDHPFLYAILHEDKILFTGTYAA